jgi:hypothetical protein
VLTDDRDAAVRRVANRRQIRRSRRRLARGMVPCDAHFARSMSEAHVSEGLELNLKLLERSLREAGYASSARFHGQEPYVGLVDGEKGHYVGRFFPSRNAILVHRDADPEVTRARLNHEYAHALNYYARCGGTAPTNRTICGYRGEHDPGFYATLEKIHRASGIPPKIARRIEGRYPYPQAWQRHAW